MKTNFLIIIYFLLSLQVFGQKNPPFSQDEVLTDLETLRESLEEAHYNLYAYTTEQSFDSAYQEVKNSIDKDSLTLLETTSLFQRLISVVNNGHTEIDFPGQSYGEYAYAGGTVFPLEVAFEYDQALVRKNWSGNDSIKEGSEILTVDGMPMAEMLSKIYPQVSAERPYLKNAKIELISFPRYYWQVFGEQDEFEVKIRSEGRVKKHTIKAVSAIEGYEMKRTEVLNAEMKLTFLGGSAYLNPGNFAGDKQKYHKFIDSAFAEIKKRKMKTLIIDLRNNAGGDNLFSDYLVSYIADRSFKWNSNFALKTSRFLKEHIRKNNDTTDVYWQKALSQENGTVYDYGFKPCQPQPGNKRFAGEVYVLINRQSHSQAAVTAAQIQDYQFGTLVGEETGDYPSLHASQFHYRLPHTRIPVKVSKGYIVRVNGSTKEQGVIPDIFIQDHLLDDNDEILDGLIRKINKEQ